VLRSSFFPPIKGERLHDRQHFIVREDFSIARPADFAGYTPAGFEALLATWLGRGPPGGQLGHGVDASKRGIGHAENSVLAIERVNRRIGFLMDAQLGIGADDIHHVDQAVTSEQRHGLGSPAGCER
jgi:hypothetical protein